MSAFKGQVLPCIHDHNGNHVIQKSITVVSNFARKAREEENCEETASFFLESLDPIINEVIHDMEGLSRHPYGCRVVQRMVEHCIEPQKSSILDSIIIHHNSLVDDQYGNYVVQRSLSYGREQDREAIFETVSGGDNVVRLSMRKQASNVVEMMIKHGNECQRQKLVQEMLNVSVLYCCLWLAFKRFTINGTKSYLNSLSPVLIILVFRTLVWIKQALHRVLS